MSRTCRGHVADATSRVTTSLVALVALLSAVSRPHLDRISAASRLSAALVERVGVRRKQQLRLIN